MAWNPDKYNEFKSFRYKPFYDLIELISGVEPGKKVIDMGCGTGELTRILADKLTDPLVVGIDSSKEMLAKAEEEFGSKNIKFEQRTIEEQIGTGEKWDIIFANASIQWVEDHKKILPQMISLLYSGGQLAIQIPAQNENLLNQIVYALVQEEPYSKALDYWKRTFPILSLDEYAQLLFENGGKNSTVYEKVYPLVVQDHNELYELISGSTLVPYFERLNGDIKEQFSKELKNRIKNQFKKMPALYAFKRILIYAEF